MAVRRTSRRPVSTVAPDGSWLVENRAASRSGRFAHEDSQSIRTDHLASSTLSLLCIALFAVAS